jgi:hypothetical protein
VSLGRTDSISADCACDELLILETSRIAGRSGRTTSRELGNAIRAHRSEKRS